MLIIISEILFHCCLPLFPFILHPLKSLYHIATFTGTWFSLGVYQLWQCFSNFTAYWNYLGMFKTILMPGIPPRDPDWIILGLSQVIPTCSLLEWWLLILCMYPKCDHQVSSFNFSLGTTSWVLWEFILLGSLLHFLWSNWISHTAKSSL